MNISLAPFKGELPAISERMLPSNNAATCLNADLFAYTLRPSKPSALEKTFASAPKSLYRNSSGEWLTWSKAGVKVAPSPLNDDVWKRIYWTGDGAPKMAPFEQAFSGSYPGASYRLGIPAPTSAVAPEAAGHDVPAESYEIDTVYTLTFVSAYGEEGPPAPASKIVNRWDGKPTEIKSIPVPPTGNHNITTKRIYRSETSGQYLLVAEIAASAETYTDSVPTEALGEPLPSLEWDMPDARMTGIEHIGNGVLAGWFDNTLCFSEAYRPHAWPVGYQMGFDSNIVGLATLQGGIVLVTESGPWLVSGTSPASMVQTKIDYRQGGVSSGSVVDMGEYAIYASNAGLIALAGSTPKIITDQVFTREQWQALDPKSIQAFRWREQYLAFYTSKQGHQGAILFDQQQGVQRFDANLTASFQDPVTGHIYIADGKNVYEWQAGNRAENSFTWKSKAFTTPRVMTFSAGRVDAANYPIKIKVIADDQELVELDLLSDRMFRLPAGMHRTWQIEVSGSHEVYNVQLANLPSSLI